MSWLKPVLWPLKLEFGWMFPKSRETVRREDLESRLYYRSGTFEEKEELRDQISKEFPNFFTSEHFK